MISAVKVATWLATVTVRQEILLVELMAALDKKQLDVAQSDESKKQNNWVITEASQANIISSLYFCYCYACLETSGPSPSCP